MPIATYSAYKTLVEAPWRPQINLKTTIAVTTPYNSSATYTHSCYSLWGVAHQNASAPGAAAAPTRSTTGALGQSNSSGVMRLARSYVSARQTGTIVIYDRLSHMSGLVGNVATAQTVNTAALTRQTSGVGVMAGIEIYTGIGSNARTFTCTYTNSAGTGSKTSAVCTIGGTDFQEARKFIPIPIASGDKGIQSIEDITLSLSTGTAGDFGITLYYPLWTIPYDIPGVDMMLDSVLDCAGMMPQIVTNACLGVLFMPAVTLNPSINPPCLDATHCFIEE